ncbi:fibronectin type III domain-containing protein [bacterium]|nr:fibronectin type III domain-containing protein [candidate division CSSED10-310 bacterium]
MKRFQGTNRNKVKLKVQIPPVRSVLGLLTLLFAVSWAQAQDMDTLPAGMTGSGMDAVEVSERPEVVLNSPEITNVMDVPSDDGGMILINWKSPEGDTKPDHYILELKGPDGLWQIATRTVLTAYQVTGLPNFVPFSFRVKAVYGNEFTVSDISEEVVAKDHWVKLGKLPVFIAIFLFVVILIAFLHAARSGVDLFVRRISGLTEVENAIGRATEMGKPVLYVPGSSSIEDVATLAALNILGEVARRTVHHDVKIICPNRDPIVYTIAREIVKETYASEGRPDAFDPDSVFFMVPDQFAYAAGVDGIMVREKPATIFLMGMFWAESLIMAETGASTGAVQIAGTDAVAQLPFFITACDYTLIGEELYAASAYLSREPLLLATLKSQDYGKLIFMIIMAVFTFLALLFGLDVVSLIQVR